MMWNFFNSEVLFLQVDPVSAGVQFDKEFVVCSLDLLSGLTEGLGSGIESLVFTSLFHIFSNTSIKF